MVIGRAEEPLEQGDPKELVARLEHQGMERMEAIKAAAKQLGLPKREVYRVAAGEADNSLPGKRRG